MISGSVKKIVLAVCIFALTGGAIPAHAQDKDGGAYREPSEKAKVLHRKILDLSTSLSDENRNHFYLIYNNHNMIETVKTVRQDVDKAVLACGKENPEIRSPLERRFSTWTDTIDPKVAEAEAFRDNMIIAQDYMEPGRIKNLLAEANGVREESSDQFKKVPVTSIEACEYLLNKMDETQDTMGNLLDQTLVGLPQILQNAPQSDESGEDAETTVEDL